MAAVKISALAKPIKPEKYIVDRKYFELYGQNH
jgi:hypothetical protein